MQSKTLHTYLKRDIGICDKQSFKCKMLLKTELSNFVESFSWTVQAILTPGAKFILLFRIALFFQLLDVNHDLKRSNDKVLTISV